ncbi:MAG: M28 family peptidase [Verrucomicrobia bacterium]|nr:M28 family peptidase [Verrucomicrobiota bacterium]
MTPRAFLFLAIFWAASSDAAESPADRTPFGFRPEDGTKQLQREAAYESLLDAKNLELWMRQMTTRPHHAGSPKAKENAEFIAGLFRSWGYETELEIYHVLIPRPKTRELQLLRPYPVTLPLTEQIIGSDAVAEALRAEALPPYNAYSGDGEVVGPLVYANRGLSDDYEVLERFGIDVKGKIVITRYGGSWRGIKPKVAHEKGAIGCIIFNDPGDDGYTQGSAYPDGAFKHDTAVQRGSVLDMPVRAGDPLTPFRGATQDAQRLPRDQADTIMKIPVLPISSVDAEKLLRALDGPVVPDHWKGALPLTYRFGGSGKTVARLKLEFNWGLVPAHNIIARLKGSEYPDEWVLRGNHHDAWVIGARDPMSGLVPLLEQARAFGMLREKTGWYPKRTLLFCVWDAEEPALLGSTEWCEHHAAELREKAVAYVNTDGTSRGFLGVAGSHALETLAAQAAHEVVDPQTGASVSDRLRASWLVNGTEERKKLAKERRDLYLGALGSGSDYTPFLQHLGIASFDVRFTGEAQGGEYHTCFDTFDHFTRFLDPGFDYCLALAKVCGRLTLRLADAEVLPFDFRGASQTYSRYLGEVTKLADDLRKSTEQANQLLEEGLPKLAADPTLPFVPPKPKEPVPFFNFALLQNAAEDLKAAAESYHQALRSVLDGKQAPAKADLLALNRALFHSERALLSEKGLPRRPWFRHQIYAPGFYTGYGVKTLPGVREAIEERKWEEADQEIRHAADALKRYAAEIRKAASLLKKTGKP